MLPTLLVCTRNTSRVHTEYGDVVLDENHGKYWHLNESATLALDVFQRGGTLDDAVTEFVEAFGIDPDTARTDITVLRTRLRDSGLIG